MIRLEKSEALQRKIRQDDAADLGIPTRDLIFKAFQSGNMDKAREFMDYYDFENRLEHEGIVAMASAVLSHLATFGEEEVEKAWRKRYEPRMKDWIARIPGVLENLQLFVEYQRGLLSNLTVVEEPDRYVVRCDPCGSGGRLERTDTNVTKKAYPWAWSKIGVPYYCAHCCIAYEIVPTELRGYPLKILEVPEKLGDPCIHIQYKKPELIPEEYFTRIGKTKTIK
jgi:hypothetical protein